MKVIISSRSTVVTVTPTKMRYTYGTFTAALHRPNREPHEFIRFFS
ncbi:hypothetical protein VCR15J5_540059 [Vibrio crassostreae]|nr:hypothetical protein VCR9J2_10017 [Vibrio crassostreae]CDT30146.1 hypothetical protein VCR15J5_540059 [Vibrio crassostreae]